MSVTTFAPSLVTHHIPFNSWIELQSAMTDFALQRHMPEPTEGRIGYIADRARWVQQANTLVLEAKSALDRRKTNHWQKNLIYNEADGPLWEMSLDVYQLAPPTSLLALGISTHSSGRQLEEKLAAYLKRDRLLEKVEVPLFATAASRDKAYELINKRLSREGQVIFSQRNLDVSLCDSPLANSLGDSRSLGVPMGIVIRSAHSVFIVDAEERQVASCLAHGLAQFIQIP